MTDDPALVEALLREVAEHIVRPIEEAGERLKRHRKLLQQYHEQCDAWRAGRLSAVRHITERINELCIAKLIVEDTTVAEVEYEAPVAGTTQTIDLLVRPESDRAIRLFYDVKTVHR